MLKAEELQEVVSRLVTRTQQGAIKWETMRSSAHEYMHKTMAFGYFVRSQDGDDRPPYVLEIYKYPADEGNGVMIVDVNSMTSEGRLLALDDLYDAAKKSALGLENVVASLLDDIG